MPFDSDVARQGGRDNLNPHQIAHNPLFTAREKIDLLHRLKADSQVDDLGFSPEEIDEAINEVRLGAQNGVGTQTVLGGDF